MKNFLFIALLGLCTLSVSAKKVKNKFVEVVTTEGKIKIELYADVPLHAENFIRLVEAHFYDSVLFHRVIPQFMIQGGDPDSKQALTGQMLGNGGVDSTIPAEFRLPTYYHKKGALAAARDNNPEKRSSGCQFYLVVGKTFTDEQLTQVEGSTGVKYSEQARKDYKTIGGAPHLDGSYTVYGQVVEGQDIVDKISMAERDASDRPRTDVRVLSMRVVKK